MGAAGATTGAVRTAEVGAGVMVDICQWIVDLAPDELVILPWNTKFVLYGVPLCWN